MKNESVNKKGRSAVFAIFDDQLALENAVDTLKSEGFRNSDISILMQSKGQTTDFAHKKNTKAPEGLATGATAGLFAGGALGWLVGVGLLTIPGLGPLVAAGPIMAALAGAGVGGTVGGITGGLIGLGMPEFEAKRYESYVQKGGKLISIHVDDSEWEDKAKQVLEDHGAKDISKTHETNVAKEDRKQDEDELYTQSHSL